MEALTLNLREHKDSFCNTASFFQVCEPGKTTTSEPSLSVFVPIGSMDPGPPGHFGENETSHTRIEAHCDWLCATQLSPGWELEYHITWSTLLISEPGKNG